MKHVLPLLSMAMDSLAAIHAADPLPAAPDFKGASVRAVEIDDVARSISFTPGDDPVRGWPCWWCSRVDGITPGETINLKLRGSTATVPAKDAGAKSGAPTPKLPAADWAMPIQATFSTDGDSWQHTENVKRQDEWIVCTLKPTAKSVFVAWGCPTRRTPPRSSFGR